MPNNIHYLTDRLPKANYQQKNASDMKTAEHSKLKAERTMPVGGEVDEVLDSNEKSNFLADIKKKSRIRKASAVRGNGSIQPSPRRASPTRPPNRGGHSLPRSNRYSQKGIAKSGRLRKKQEYVNRYMSQDPKNIE